MSKLCSQRLCVWAVLFVLGAALTTVSGADAPSVDEIVRKANLVAYYQGKDGKARVNMTITSYEKMDEKGNPIGKEKKNIRTQ